MSCDFCSAAMDSRSALRPNRARIAGPLDPASQDMRAKLSIAVDVPHRLRYATARRHTTSAREVVCLSAGTGRDDPTVPDTLGRAITGENGGNGANPGVRVRRDGQCLPGGTRLHRDCWRAGDPDRAIRRIV
jgi:hypothetical protein